jgi:membrane protease YdiL (CAAX protease family)
MDPKPPVVPFLLLTLVFSLPFYLALNLAGGRGEGMRLYVTGLMWCPALAALLACRIGRLPLATLGWRWPPARWLWLSYLLPVAYGLLVYVPVWLLGLGDFGAADYGAYAGKMLGFAPWPAWVRVLLMIVLQASAGFVLSCASALGEELGWRGFLAPALLARFGFTGGSCLTGLIWASWHVPVLFWLNYGDETPRAFAMACFTLSLVGISFVCSWLRLRTGSVWPAVVLHASHNVFITPVFSMLTVANARTPWAIDEFGFMLAIVSVALGAWAWSKRGEAEGRAAA